MKTILVVDDEEPVRDLLAMLLQDAGYRVLVAFHGRQALQVMEEERPDLIIADVMMPILNGVELCQRLSASEDLKEIPVILMSAAGQDVTRGAGADAFIAKPFDFDDVEALVARWLPPAHYG